MASGTIQYYEFSVNSANKNTKHKIKNLKRATRYEWLRKGKVNGIKRI